MAGNDIGPYYVRVPYDSNNGNRGHSMKFSVAGVGTWEFGTPPSVLTRAGGTIALFDQMDLFVTALAPMFSSDSTILRYEAYYKATPTSSPVLVDLQVSNAPGTQAAGSDKTLMEAIFTFKTPSKGGLKLNLQEQNYDKDLRLNEAAIIGSSGQDLMQFVMSDDNFIIGRNGEQPAAFLHMTSKENDHWRAKDLLPS